MVKRLLVIGGNAAGLSAASQVKRLRPDWEVIVFEQGSNISYASCGLPYYLSGMVDSIDQLVELSPRDVIHSRNIDLRLHHEVIKIFPDESSVLVRSTQEEKVEDYDYLMIATGSSSSTMGLKLEKFTRVFTLKSLEDGARIHEMIQGHPPKKVAVIGGGYIGLELLETMGNLHLETHFIHRREDLARIFERETSDLLKEKMCSKGIHMKLNTQIHDIKESHDRVIIDTQDGPLEYDMVFLGLGVSPNTHLAKDADIALGVKGAIKVNQYLETNWKNIYAGGD